MRAIMTSRGCSGGDLDVSRSAPPALGTPLALRLAPPLALRLALGEMADALLLASQRVQPECLLQHGFAFRYENLEAALHAALAKP